MLDTLYLKIKISSSVANIIYNQLKEDRSTDVHPLRHTVGIGTHKILLPWANQTADLILQNLEEYDFTKH